MSVLKLLTLVLATDIHFLSKMSCAIRLQLVISNAWFQNFNDNIKHFRIFLVHLWGIIFYFPEFPQSMTAPYPQDIAR